MFLLVPLFVHIQRRTLRKRDAVGGVEGLQVNLVVADALPDRHHSPQEFTMLAGIERRQRKLVPPFLLAPAAHLPDKVFGCLTAEPRLQHVPDAEPLALTSEEVPRALQTKPEPHKVHSRVGSAVHSVREAQSCTSESGLTPVLLTVR